MNKSFKMSVISAAVVLSVNIVVTPNVFAGGDHGGHSNPKAMMNSDRNMHGSMVDKGQHDHGGHSSKVGMPATKNEANKTVHVVMYDSMKYEFSKPLDIKSGDIVRFVVANKGKITHEFSIGNKEEQRKHAKMMRQMPNMVHQDGNTLSLEAGDTGEIVWRFEGDPSVIFACNIPGHFEAGMFAKTSVKAGHSHNHN